MMAERLKALRVGSCSRKAWKPRWQRFRAPGTPSFLCKQFPDGRAITTGASTAALCATLSPAAEWKCHCRTLLMAAEQSGGLCWKSLNKVRPAWSIFRKKYVPRACVKHTVPVNGYIETNHTLRMPTLQVFPHTGNPFYLRWRTVRSMGRHNRPATRPR